MYQFYSQQIVLVWSSTVVPIRETHCRNRDTLWSTPRGWFFITRNSQLENKKCYPPTTPGVAVARPQTCGCWLPSWPKAQRPGQTWGPTRKIAERDGFWLAGGDMTSPSGGSVCTAVSSHFPRCPAAGGGREGIPDGSGHCSGCGNAKRGWPQGRRRRRRTAPSMAPPLPSSDEFRKGARGFWIQKMRKVWQHLSAQKPCIGEKPQVMPNWLKQFGSKIMRPWSNRLKKNCT